MLVNNVFLIKFVCCLIYFSIFLLFFFNVFFFFFFLVVSFAWIISTEGRKLEGRCYIFFLSSLSYFKVPGWEGQK
jgi:hypothetical protein